MWCWAGNSERLQRRRFQGTCDLFSSSYTVLIEQLLKFSGTCVSPFSCKKAAPISWTHKLLQVCFITSCARLRSQYKTDKNVGEVAFLGSPAQWTETNGGAAVFWRQIFLFLFFLCTKVDVGNYCFRSMSSVLYCGSSGSESDEKMHQLILFCAHLGSYSVVLPFWGSLARKMIQRCEFQVIFNMCSLLTLRDLSTVQEN